MRRRHCLAAVPGLAAGAWVRPVRATAAPRIVSVGGALTEIVYRLGAEAQLVGTDTTSVHPPAALHTPKVGYQRQLSAEGLLALRPDVLLATDEAGPPVVLAQLRSAGVRLQQVPTSHDFAELQRKVAAVGQATGRSAQADALLARLHAEWQAARPATAPAAGAPRVLFVLAHGNAPQVSGEGTAAHAMITLAGGRNALNGFSGYRPMTAEAVVAAAPDLVLTTRQAVDAAGGVDRFWDRPGLALTPAGRQRRLHAPDALWLLGFGPRLPAAVAALATELSRPAGPRP